MKFQKFTKEQLKTVYKERMTFDFPEAELKPLEAILDMMDRDCYDALAVVIGGEICGYSLMTKIPGQDYLLLDYLSIYKEYRLSGVGSRVLSKLKEYYSGKTIFIESENPDFMEGYAKETAGKRLGFYEKNGARNTGVLTRIWTVPYINYVLSDKVMTKEEVTRALNVIYEIMIPKKSTREKMVEIPQKALIQLDKQ